jgi:DNA-binding MarR family transcriptional regulator
VIGLSSTTPPDLLPPAVRDGPATPKLVYLALEGHGPATVETLALATGQSRRSVERALSGLEDRDLADPRPDPTDPRRQVWVTTG